MTCMTYQRRSVWVHKYVKLLSLALCLSSGSTLCQCCAAAAPRRRHRRTHTLIRHPCGVTSLSISSSRTPERAAVGFWALNLNRAASSPSRSELESAGAPCAGIRGIGAPISKAFARRALLLKLVVSQVSSPMPMLTCAHFLDAQRCVRPSGTGPRLGLGGRIIFYFLVHVSIRS